MRRGLLAFAGAALLLGTAYAGSAGQSVSASATAPLPIVATVQPSTGPLSGGQSVIVSGQNFQTGATVGFGNWATMPGQWIDSAHLRVTTPSFPNEGVVSVTVTNPDGQSASAQNGYAYLHGIYTLDGFGGMHPDGGSAPVSGGAYWTGWKIARAAVLTSDNSGGLVLDGYGGLHPFGSMTVQPAAAYFGWDIARDVALLPASSIFEAQGYTLDGWGGVHAFGGAPPPHGFAYWPGWSIAKKIRLLPDGTGGYVLDGYGGLHGFAVGSNPMPPLITNYAYWGGSDIARDFAIAYNSSAATGIGGVTLDGLGGVHAFGNVNSVTLFPPYIGSSVRDTFRALTLAPQAPLADLAGWTMDGYGGIYPFGRWVPPVRPLGGQWPNWDIAVSLVVQ